jgi:hypothetical protein
MIMSIRLSEFGGFLYASQRTNHDRLTTAMAEKYGYDDVEDFVQNAQKKFSLIETGIVDQENCRLLLLNVRFLVQCAETQKLTISRALTTASSQLRTAMFFFNMEALRKPDSSRTGCTWVTPTLCQWLTRGWRVCCPPTWNGSRTERLSAIVYLYS